MKIILKNTNTIYDSTIIRSVDAAVVKQVALESHHEVTNSKFKRSDYEGGEDTVIQTMINRLIAISFILLRGHATLFARGHLNLIQ